MLFLQETMTILIITHSKDNESSLVMEVLQAQGGKAFRFDTDRFPTDIGLDAYYGHETEQLTLVSEREKLDLREVSAVWYRRMRMGAKKFTSMDSRLRSVQEFRLIIQGAIASLKAFHLDPLLNIRRAENKQLQLQAARELGLEIPRTLMTNNPQTVLEFAQACETGMVAKMLSSFAICEEGQGDFTDLASKDLDNLDKLRSCPMVFQENIPKALELRTIVVGKRIFTASIDSQRFGTRQDWRRQKLVQLNAWKPYELPQAVEEKLMKLLQYFGLNYGAIDFILTPDGRHVFLEVNPVGEYSWLERCPGFPISQAIAELLKQSN